MKEEKLKKIAEKIVPVIIWFAIILIFIACILLSLSVLEKNSLSLKIIVAIMVILMLYFVTLLLISVVRYKQDLVISNNEPNYWKKISPEFKRIQKHLFIVSILFNLFMIIISIYYLTIGNLTGLFLLILGISLLIGAIIRRDEMLGKKQKRMTKNE